MYMQKIECEYRLYISRHTSLLFGLFYQYGSVSFTDAGDIMQLNVDKRYTGLNEN